MTSLIMRPACPTHHRFSLYRASVYALCVTYGLFFFLGSLCLATGLLHPHDASDAHHHSHETDHTVTFLDICDLTLLTLTTTDLETSVLPASMLAFSKTGFEVRSTPRRALSRSQLSIRAPPFAFS